MRATKSEKERLWARTSWSDFVGREIQSAAENTRSSLCAADERIDKKGERVTEKREGRARRERQMRKRLTVVCR